MLLMLHAFLAFDEALDEEERIDDAINHVVREL
jgi:hypothetical protein